MGHGWSCGGISMDQMRHSELVGVAQLGNPQHQLAKRRLGERIYWSTSERRKKMRFRSRKPSPLTVLGLGGSYRETLNRNHSGGYRRVVDVLLSGVRSFPAGPVRRTFA